MASPATSPSGGDRERETVLRLASPRGFCAGVERAVRIVELALGKYGPPVYVRHEIVHNRHVVERLERDGAIFVDELDEVPDGARVIFSAHGVPGSVPEEARRRNLPFLDATCPLVSKVHREARRRHQAGDTVILVGHAGHPEVIGTMGQLPPGGIILVESREDARTLVPPPGATLSWITQTTLSVDETREITDILKQRFPGITGPARDDICYATTNRQEAVRALAPLVTAMLVIGAANSSNSLRLAEVAAGAGVACVHLITGAGDIPWESLDGHFSIGLTASASAPGNLVEETIDAFRQRRRLRLERDPDAGEDVHFRLPAGLDEGGRAGETGKQHRRV